MIQRRSAKFLLGLLLGSLAALSGAQQISDTVMILPFKDQSGFKGPWNVSKGIQHYIADALARAAVILPPDSAAGRIRSYNTSDYERIDKLLEIRNRLGCRYLIAGRITDFYAVKKMAGSGRLGGYKHYNAGIEAEVKIFDARARRWVDEFNIRVHKRNLGMKVNMPGKISQDEENFFLMEQKEFGSDAFRKTVAGETMDEACKEILAHLRKVHEAAPLEATVSASPKTETQSQTGKAVQAPVQPKVFEGKVLTVADSTVYVNLGFGDSIVIGDRFPIYAAGDAIINPESGDTLGFTDKKIGEIEITFIKAGHLSSARVLSGRDGIKVGSRARVSR